MQRTLSTAAQAAAEAAAAGDDHATLQVLNEIVIDRGPSSYLSDLDVYVDDVYLTTVQGDGLIISTPTGSTAYSLSAGGSMCHPNVNAILLTPICPHSLSFRPLLLPDTVEVKVGVPVQSRNTAWTAFDGRSRRELKQGDVISISASDFPVTAVNKINQSVDWFESIGRCLSWNYRTRQKPLAPTTAATSGDGGEGGGAGADAAGAASAAGGSAAGEATTGPAARLTQARRKSFVMP